jgi:hypothetical protein
MWRRDSNDDAGALRRLAASLKEQGQKNPALKSKERRIQTTEAYTNEPDFTEVERPVFPRCDSSFLKKLLLTDTHLGL